MDSTLMAFCLVFVRLWWQLQSKHMEMICRSFTALWAVAHGLLTVCPVPLISSFYVSLVKWLVRSWRKMCYTVELGWVKWLYYKCDSSKQNALGILNPIGWRGENPVSVVIHETRFSVTLGYIHNFSIKYTSHALNVGYFISLKIRQLENWPVNYGFQKGLSLRPV